MAIVYNKKRLLSLKTKASSMQYGIELIRKYPDKFNWDILSEHIGGEYIEEFKKRINWHTFAYNKCLRNHKIFLEYFDKIKNTDIKWAIFNSGSLDDEEFTLINVLKDRFDWSYFPYEYLPEHKIGKILEKFSSYVNWDRLSRYLRVPDDEFILKYKDNINWNSVIQNSYSSIAMKRRVLELIPEKVEWNTLPNGNVRITCEEANLHSDEINWRSFSIYGNYDINFLMENINKINLDVIHMNENIRHIFRNVSTGNDDLDLYLKLNNIQMLPIFMMEGK